MADLFPQADISPLFYATAHFCAQLQRVVGDWWVQNLPRAPHHSTVNHLDS